MFYCQECATRNGWPDYYGLPVSRGPCEVCNTVSACFDMPSRSLPRKKPEPPR